MNLSVATSDVSITDSHISTRMRSSEVFFKIKLNVFLDTLILKLFFKIIKIPNFRGDLSDISA